MAREYDRKNPAFASAHTGVEANHSSAEKSVASAPDAQSDDSINDISVKMDPNISGMAPTEDCYTWLAGKLDGWQENDDYREYFEQSRGCDGMLGCGHDGDYDDNGGYPTAIGHSRGISGPKGSSGVGEDHSSHDYQVSPIYIRRV
jgi:hypothetical protein